MAGSARICVSGSPGPLQPSRGQNLKNPKRYRARGGNSGEKPPPGTVSVLGRGVHGGIPYGRGPARSMDKPPQPHRHSLVQPAAFGRDDPGLSGGACPHVSASSGRRREPCTALGSGIPAAVIGPPLSPHQPTCTARYSRAADIAPRPSLRGPWRDLWLPFIIQGL